MTTPTEYRSGVGIVLFNADGLVFVGRRRDGREPPWQLPQGGLFPDEKPEQAALRELVEETGTAKAHVVATLPSWLQYDYPATTTARRADRYRGQRHRWFLMRFTGTDADIDIATGHPEFRDWQWLPAHELVDRVVGFKREVYRTVLATFSPIIDNCSASPPHCRKTAAAQAGVRILPFTR